MDGPSVTVSMKRNILLTAALAASAFCGGCDQLGLGHDEPVADGAPAEQDLQKIHYMSTSEAKGRRIYDHLEQAKTCSELELAMRWNRPPNVAGGAFHQKMTFLGAEVPADLPKNTEVFFTAKIEKFEPLPDGSAGWRLHMPGGASLQAVEMANFWQKEEQAEDTKPAALVRPNQPGRMLCGQGVYQGRTGQDPGHDGPVPVISVLYAMDRVH